MMQDTRLVYVRLHGPEIFLEQGRLLFSLLYAFASAGYKIEIHPELGPEPLERYGRMIYDLPGLGFTHTPPPNPAAAWYLYDYPDRALSRLQWSKRVRVRYDLFSAFWRTDPIIMPYYMYPLQTRLFANKLDALRSTDRKMRIFFSGDSEKYRREWVNYPQRKLPRESIVYAIKREFESCLLVNDAGMLSELMRGPFVNKFVLTASSQVRIDVSEWLPTVARADFFLCPPGIVMPMSHNIIESMAVGTIPITNYPEWLDPPLRHGRDCLAFNDLDELLAVLRLAVEMSETEIRCMRANVTEYYERYLRPDVFVRRVESHPGPEVPIIMYTERNVALRSKRLGRHSILMQGTVHRRPRGLIPRLANVYLRPLVASQHGPGDNK